jgi:hypothetical protein
MESKLWDEARFDQGYVQSLGRAGLVLFGPEVEDEEEVEEVEDEEDSRELGAEFDGVAAAGGDEPVVLEVVAELDEPRESVT